MIVFPERKFNIIYADPPWQFSSKAYQDGGRDMLKLEETQYNTMTIKDIKSLPVKEIADEDCACFMWVTDSHLKEGIEVLESWGFKYKTIAFVWLKKYDSGDTCYNFAPWTLKSHEICLLGIKGRMTKHNVKNNVKGFVEAVRGRHSEKPQEIRRRIEELFGDIPRIELFAREYNKGWYVWGNEANNICPECKQGMSMGEYRNGEKEPCDECLVQYDLG
ncbi:DNA methyltransferase [Neobacillus sp. YIM B02564]|uniref:DNA methyltransferase n=1 Tax=Neobacillus paridis TaxID=2803862 RepID=A0ABS1TJ87_9BACI|nr:MT-A70 family methyltransferase [Neobacillus paridis]MBL4951094.1 DNA methyltransferase [Neobacillus paridis]